MTPNEYQQLAGRTECDQISSLERMADQDHGSNDNPRLIPIRLNHAVLGLVGEVGELAAAVEKHIYYGQQRDDKNIAEELGDALWYIAEACNALGFSLEEIMQANIAKLAKRYPNKYSDERALEANRDREAELNCMNDKFGEGLDDVSPDRDADERNSPEDELEQLRR